MWLIDKIEDLFPSTPLAFLIYLGAFSLISVILIFVAAKIFNKPKKTTKTPSKKELSIDDLLKIAKNPKSSKVDLITAIELFVQNFKIKDDEKKSFEFFEKLLNHKNRDKKIFDIFHGKVIAANIEYKDRLDKMERKALNK